MPPGFRYGIAIDAGSSGSRIYLYRWPKTEPSQAFTKVEEQAVFSQARTPGITANHGIGLSLLEELIDLAKSALPSDVDPSEVPVYLGATAGMRIINAAGQADIMHRIRSLLRLSGFLFRDDWARIISGEEEGVYDWLVANYLKNKGDLSTASATTYGALDLGGASTQISFISAPVVGHITQKLRGQLRNGFPVRIDNMDYPLFAESFLYYGVNQARMQYDIKNASVTKINPCYPTGYTDPNSNISGSSNWEECLETVATFFEHTSSCHGERARCLMGDIHQSHTVSNQTFIAMSAFFYTWEYLGLNTGTETDDLVELNAKAHSMCNLSQTKQMAHYQKRMKNKPSNRAIHKPYSQCFNAAYSYHLLTKGYGMPVSKTPIEIHFDINGIKVQWALGMMLVEANQLSWIFRGSAPKLDAFGSIGYEHMVFFAYLLLIPTAILLLFTWLFSLNRKLQSFSPRKGR